MLRELKSDEKGFYVSMTTIAIFLLTAMLIFLILPQFYHLVTTLDDSKVAIEEMVIKRNRDERVAALINNDPSFVGNVPYEPGYGNIEIEEVRTKNEGENIIERVIIVKDKDGEVNRYFKFE